MGIDLRLQADRFRDLDPEPPPMRKSEPKEPEPDGDEPTLSDVLYTPPNPDGSRKVCGNCVFYTLADGGRCGVHAVDQQIPVDAVCGYHVFGHPTPHKLTFLGILPVTPEQSGLLMETPLGGTSCNRCKAYEPDGPKKGTCVMVVDNRGNFASVEARGCCARWRKAPYADEDDD